MNLVKNYELKNIKIIQGLIMKEIKENHNKESCEKE